MSFSSDLDYSKHKDVLLKPFWTENSYEGRHIYVNHKFLQNLKIDILLQGEQNNTEYSIDTKHQRNNFNTFFLEEMSCTIPGREKPGWILEESEYYPDYIFYLFWPECSKCYGNCFDCNKNLFFKMYYFIFNELRDWFIENKDKYPLRYTKQINKTSGRIVPILDCIGAGFCSPVMGGYISDLNGFISDKKGQLTLTDFSIIKIKHRGKS